jgi:hypothetical protein
MGQLSWNGLAWFNRCCLASECHRLMLGTVRHRMLDVAGKIERHSRRWLLMLSEEKVFQDGWKVALQQ